MENDSDLMLEWRVFCLLRVIMFDLSIRRLMELGQPEP
jgi:hypothetical protein